MIAQDGSLYLNLWAVLLLMVIGVVITFAALKMQGWKMELLFAMHVLHLVNWLNELNPSDGGCTEIDIKNTGGGLTGFIFSSGELPRLLARLEVEGVIKRDKETRRITLTSDGENILQYGFREKRPRPKTPKRGHTN
ncbi:hypothetical protein KBD34_05305 [Patescibacteria group bacterium]|nr:hypothetical protein [Patescibacteria group bacterium]